MRTTANPRTASIKLSMDSDTKCRLTAYAGEQRKSVSQLITDWIWSQPVKTEAKGKEETK